MQWQKAVWWCATVWKEKQVYALLQVLQVLGHRTGTFISQNL